MVQELRELTGKRSLKHGVVLSNDVLELLPLGSGAFL